ncbi:hypothetical protein COT97_03850 [Candidatus Falkowbacteria bacterium CG10_big_fil_rev_8_21_14_0_10_39_11]|uniref:Uncharacterized protein n=1 Tax=Candidatus Falkowbacteria bacterium CG10_big_fil_rev_8_21_14_0_10_39_11 TaxID=1974565 RepID=A0A2H0V6K0_9BACT|nr:MAG: hypothetical protein COT97_03850 [Candidatus Falkowbacteria bacterium CG10_big_fil_rev_8_21_14_0_10_39_11]
MEKARNLLRSIKSNCDDRDVSDLINQLKDHCGRKRVLLAYVSTSESELNHFQRRGFQAAARRALYDFRQAKTDQRRRTCIDKFRYYLDLSGCSAGEFGVSQSQMEKFGQI